MRGTLAPPGGRLSAAGASAVRQWLEVRLAAACLSPYARGSPCGPGYPGDTPGPAAASTSGEKAEEEGGARRSGEAGAGGTSGEVSGVLPFYSEVLRLCHASGLCGVWRVTLGSLGSFRQARSYVVGPADGRSDNPPDFS